MPRSVLSPQPSSSAAVLLVLVAAASVSLGVIATVLLAPQPTPPTLGIPTQSQSVVVEAVPFFDERQVSLEVVSTRGLALASPRDGVLTSFVCAPGTVWRSAAAIGTVNGEPLVGLHLSSPPWRDFEAGAKGADVEALQTELSRLGYQATVTGSYGNETKLAVRALLRDLGFGGNQSALRLSDFVWLPEIEVSISSCSAARGSSLANGSELASSDSAVSEVKLLDVPSDLLPGERVLAIADAEVATSDVASITDPTSIAVLSAAPEFAAHQRDSEIPLFGRLRLADPLLAIRVPAGSVIGAGTPQTCVLSGGKPIPVSIVGSSLGSTLVTVVGSAAVPPARVDLPSQSAALSCS